MLYLLSGMCTCMDTGKLYVEELNTIMSHTNNLGRNEISRLVIRLAIPTMLAQLVNVLYSIVDRM